MSRVVLTARLALLLALLAPVSAWTGSDPELPRLRVDTAYAPPVGRTIAVAAGGDFLAALKRAQPGDVITLEAGARFTGNFTLPAKTGSGWIIIRTSAPDSSLPAPDSRITPAYACVLPKIVSPNSSPALTIAPGAHHYRFIGVEFTVAADVPAIQNLLGNRSPASPAEVAHDLVFDRVYVHGNPRVNLRRAFALNSAATAIINSYVSEIHEVGADSQAIGAWSGPGPFKIVNNYLEAAGENVLFGGADPPIRDLVPSDIEIRGNHFFKPLTWRIEDPSYAGTPWTVKNLFELKNARRVLIDGNLFEHNWMHGQGGTAIVLTVRNQDGAAPWSVVEDVTFTNNIVRHTGTGIGMHNRDGNFPSQPTKRILIRNNLFVDVNGVRWGGLGHFFGAFGGIEDLVIEHNTALQGGSIVYVHGGSFTRFVYRHNIAPHNEYGIHGTGSAPGNHTLAMYVPGGVVEKNVIIGNPYPLQYPPNNFHPPSLAAVGFVNQADGDYRLSASSRYKRAGSDGKDIGVDFEALAAAMTAASAPETGRDPCGRTGTGGK